MKHQKRTIITLVFLSITAILLLSACTSPEPALSEQDPPVPETEMQPTPEQYSADAAYEDSQQSELEDEDETLMIEPEITLTLMQPVYRNELAPLDTVPTLGIPGDDENDEVLLLVQIDGLDQSQDPGAYEVRFAINGVALPKTITPQQQIADETYWALDLFPLGFDAGEHTMITLEAWVELPSGVEIRHTVEDVELANCGWTATLYEGKDGEIKGELTYPTETFAGRTAEQLAQLAGIGNFGPMGGSDIPSTDELARAPESYMLASRETLPYMQIIPGMAATAMLDPNVLSFGQQVSLDMVHNDEIRKQGTFTISMAEMLTQTNFSVEGEFTWHVDSLCSLDAMIEFGTNPYPDGMVPARLRE